MTGWSNTSVTARRSALAPSSTTRIGRVVSSPRSRRPASSSVTTVAFSVAPSARASGTLVPSMVMPRATTQVCSATRMPSTISATRSRPDRSGGQQLGQGVLGARPRTGATPPTWRSPNSPVRLGCRPVPAQVVAAGRQLGQHPLQGQLVQQLGPGERLPGRQSQLGGAVGAAHPWPLDPHPAAAEGDLAGLGAVADRGPVGLWRPLGPTSRSTSSSSRLPSTPRPVPTARASRPSRAAPASSASATVTRSGRTSSASAGRVGAYPSALAVPFWSSGLAVARHLPHGRHQAGTATSTSTKPGTTSSKRPPASPVSASSLCIALIDGIRLQNLPSQGLEPGRGDPGAPGVAGVGELSIEPDP